MSRNKKKQIARAKDLYSCSSLDPQRWLHTAAIVIFFLKMLLRINTCAFLLVTIASVCLLVEFENTCILLEAATGCPTVRYYLHRQVGGTWSELSMQSFLFVRSYGRSECEKLDSVCCAGFVTMFSCDHLVSGCIWFWRLVAESRCLPLRFIGVGLAFLL